MTQTRFTRAISTIQVIFLFFFSFAKGTFPSNQLEGQILALGTSVVVFELIDRIKRPSSAVRAPASNVSWGVEWLLVKKTIGSLLSAFFDELVALLSSPFRGAFSCGSPAASLVANRWLALLSIPASPGWRPARRTGKAAAAAAYKHRPVFHFKVFFMLCAKFELSLH